LSLELQFTLSGHIVSKCNNSKEHFSCYFCMNELLVQVVYGLNKFTTPWFSDRQSYQPIYGNCSETVLFLVKWFRSCLQANINQSQAQDLISHVISEVWVHHMFSMLHTMKINGEWKMYNVFIETTCRLLMNSFIKTVAAVLTCRLCFLGAFPFRYLSRWITIPNTNKTLLQFYEVYNLLCF